MRLRETPPSPGIGTDAEGSPAPANVDLRRRNERNAECGADGCGHRFEPGELRYRADDGKDYCAVNGHGVAMWRIEQGA